jgi:chromate transporter
VPVDDAPAPDRTTPATAPTPAVALAVVAREWGRIGVTGFGGPPVHIALLRRLVVAQHGWMAPADFEAAIAACNLLPGPASTQLAIYVAGRMAGRRGAMIGGLCFVLPSVVGVTILSALFLASAPPAWIRGAGAGAGAAVAAVAVHAGLLLLGPSRRRAWGDRARAARWLLCAAAGALGAALAGPYLVLVLVGCGVAEVARRSHRGGLASLAAPLLAGLVTPLPAAVTAGGLGALAWVAIKVGALSYGGGFVIVPLMQNDAVHVYHWLSSTQFLSAVALGQVTPGPVVATVAAIGFAAHGVAGAALAALVAFAPSFAFVLAGGRQFDRLRSQPRAQAFLDGAGPAALGAILGSALPLALALQEWWQWAILAGAGVALLLGRRGVVAVLIAAGLLGAGAALLGAALPR